MKFKTDDAAYLGQRRTISEQSGPRELWSVIDHWPLYVGTANLGRFLAIADLFRSTLDVPGHVAEFGCWRGANLMFLAKMLRLFDPHGSKLVHGFDTWQGLTEFVAEDEGAVEKRGAYKGSLDELKEMMDLYRLQDDVVLHMGTIEETLPRLVEEDKSLTFSFAYCDTDLYASTKVIVENVHPRLAKGGIMVFDEWNRSDYPGEGRAVNEFLASFGQCYEVLHVKGARQPSLALRKIAY